MVSFSERIVTDVVQTFWAARQRGEFITDAAAEAGTYRKKDVLRWAGASGARGGRGKPKM
jgi:IS30 family transposase